MKDKELEKSLEKIIELYTKIEEEILQEIAGHFLIEDEFQNSDYWRVKKLEELGQFNNRVIEYISKYSKTAQKEIIKAFEEIGINAIDIKRLEKAYKKGLINIDPKVLKDNPIIKQILENTKTNMEHYIVQMSNKIISRSRDAYLNVLEETYLKTTMGVKSYQEAIVEAINRLGNEGITTLTYEDNGKIRHYDIEATIRRDTLTQARDMNLKLTEEVIKETQPEYLYLSEHLACREEHFPWQGTIIKADELVDITDYGSITGLGGINCRHYFEPYFGDERGNELKTFNEKECSIAYDLSQHQRYLERGIRKWKRKANMFKKMGDIEHYDYCMDKSIEWQQRNQTFIELINSTDYELKRDFVREYVK